MKIDWKRKLSSRKFWALIAGFVGSLLVVFNVSENEIAQIIGVITAFGTVAVYIFAEASVDKASIGENRDDLKNDE
ncbi:hypothetical protein NSQ62_07740 [Solibacillus sp. FSL H8-0523]|uniref:hypothetical protein n=1 Tax=Solibacillus sp. FSL H8-0523 TaxID=2954511 RepID=UPI00310128D6